MECPRGTVLQRGQPPWADEATTPQEAATAQWCEVQHGGRVALHGPYLELYPDGSTARQGFYRKGIQVGPWVRWTANGDLLGQRVLWPGESGRYLPRPEDMCPPGTIRDRSRGHDHKKRMWSHCYRLNEQGEQVLEGPYVTWDLEGTRRGGARYLLRRIANYRDGELHGPQLRFAGPFGREVLVQEEGFEDGNAQGPSLSYFLDGSLREQRYYERARLHGERVGFAPGGAELWRVSYEHGDPGELSGDLSIDGQPCPDHTVPTYTADALELVCARHTHNELYRDGPFVQRDAAGRVVQRGLYRGNEKVELWQAPAGVELPPTVSDQVLVAEIELRLGQRAYRELSSLAETEPEESVQWSEEALALEAELQKLEEARAKRRAEAAAGAAASGGITEGEDAAIQGLRTYSSMGEEADAGLELGPGQPGDSDAVADPAEPLEALPTFDDQLTVTSCQPEPGGQRVPLDIWFKNNDTRKHVSARTEVCNGIVSVYGLPPGNYYMKVEVDANQANEEQWPGDLISSSEFAVVQGEVTQTSAQLRYTLHLTEPWDNNEIIPGWQHACRNPKAVLQGPVRFAWNPPEAEDPRGIEYGYRLLRRRCDPFEVIETVVETTTYDTAVQLDLPVSRVGELYEWTMWALRDGVSIGEFMAFGNGGYGWSLRFRVRE